MAKMRAMTLGEFREETKDEPDETLMVLSSDEEGNTFHPVNELGWNFFYRDRRELINISQEDDETSAEFADRVEVYNAEYCLTLCP